MSQIPVKVQEEVDTVYEQIAIGCFSFSCVSLLPPQVRKDLPEDAS